MNISYRFQVYKISHSIFQIGELDIDSDYKNNIISLLELGNKFVPNYFAQALIYHSRSTPH